MYVYLWLFCVINFKCDDASLGYVILLFDWSGRAGIYRIQVILLLNYSSTALNGLMAGMTSHVPHHTVSKRRCSHVDLLHLEAFTK